ncbi:MAG TPA: helix-turn-helix domain-containing protein [bacterium]|nr:helix-turn-helix domain-containing protein [bacterium]
MEELTTFPLGQNEFLAIVSAYGALQGYVLAAVFWFRSAGDSLANRLLSALFLAVTIHMTEIFLYVTGLMEYVPRVAGTGFPLIFLVGPFYFLYTKRLLDARFRLRWVHLAHALPAALILADSLPWMLAPSERKIGFFRAIAQGVDIPVSSRVFVKLVFNIGQNLVYLAVTWRLVRECEGRARRQLSDTRLVASIRTLRTITASFLTYVVLHMGLYVALRIWGNRNGALVDTVWLLAISIFVQLNGYAAIARPETFSRSLWHLFREKSRHASAEDDPGPEVPEAPSAKYRHSSLGDDEGQVIQDRLLNHMRADAPYLNGQLTLRDVAAALGVSTHHLSQVLNQRVERSFFDFVNGYRIDAAKAMLAGRDDRTVLEIAYECGFNNKTSFNQAFRKFVGTTPTAYRARVRREGGPTG